MLEAKIDFATSGDNVVIAGVAARHLWVMRLFFVVGAATNVKIKDNGADLTGAIVLAAPGASFVLDTPRDEGWWFKTELGQPFTINSSVAVQVGGRVYYRVERR